MELNLNFTKIVVHFMFHKSAISWSLFLSLITGLNVVSSLSRDFFNENSE